MPVLALAVSARLAFLLPCESVPLAASLLAAGGALGGSLGRWIGCSALGLLAVWGRPAVRPDLPPTVDASRPVLLQGVQLTPWQRGEYGWWAEVGAERIRQGAVVTRWRWKLTVTVGSGTRPPAGGVLRCRGYLRRPAPLANGIQTSTRPWRMAVKTARFLSVDRQPGWLSSRTSDIRSALDRRLEGAGSEAVRMLVESLILGRSQSLGREVRQDLRRTGLSHLFVASGLHVALIMGLALTATWPLPRAARTLAAVLAVSMYVMLVGPRPSILRAAGMACFSLAGLVLGRPSPALHGLAMCVGLFVLQAPRVVLELGFQLTASATAGILILGPRLTARWHRLPRLLRAPVATTVSAQLGSAPWAWSSFDLVPGAAVLLNLAAIPWVSVTLAVACLWAIPGAVWSPLAGILEAVLEVAALPLAALSRLPPSRVLTWPLVIGFAAAAAASAGLTVALLVPRRPARVACLGLALILLAGRTPDQSAELTMIDVGQGDAFLLRDGRRAMLVDGGGWSHADIAARVLMPVLAKRGIRSLETAVVTHGDIDHCGGILDLSRYISIDTIRMATSSRGRCSEMIRSSWRARWVAAEAGDAWTVGRWRVTVIHPAVSDRWGDNDASLVLAIRGLGHRILLTGDIETRAERRILARLGEARLTSDVLKLAHHGSASSSSEEFLAAVDPALTLVSAGRHNRYGHPAEVVVGRAGRRGARLLRTDRDGMVQLLFRPRGTLEIRTFGP